MAILPGTRKSDLEFFKQHLTAWMAAPTSIGLTVAQVTAFGLLLTNSRTLFTAAETASGAAFVGAFAVRMGDVVPLAKSAEIEYEKIAHGAITARAKLGIDAAEALDTLDVEGKVECPCEVELTDKDGSRVATATVHWHVRLKR